MKMEHAFLGKRRVPFVCASLQNGLQVPGTTTSECDWVLDGQGPLPPGVVQMGNGKQGRQGDTHGSSHGPSNDTESYDQYLRIRSCKRNT
jgi:hypothetical protein